MMDGLVMVVVGLGIALAVGFKFYSAAIKQTATNAKDKQIIKK